MFFKENFLPLTLIRDMLFDGTKKIDLLCHKYVNSLKPQYTLMVDTEQSDVGFFCVKNDHFNSFLICYGNGMIQNFMQFSIAIQYTHFRESKKIGIINNAENTTVQWSLVKLILHEYAHLIQHCKGQIYFNSIHNKEFYEILKKFYDKKIDLKLYEYFSKKYPFFNKLKYDDLDNYYGVDFEKTYKDFQLKDIVKFNYKKHRYVGEIKKLSVANKAVIDIKTKYNMQTKKIVENERRITIRTIFLTKIDRQI